MVNTDTDDVNKDKWHRQGHKWQRILSGVNKIYWTIVESRTAVITMQHISTLYTWKLTCRGGGFDLCLMPMYGLEAEGKSKDSMVWHARPVNFSRRNSRQNSFFVGELALYGSKTLWYLASETSKNGWKVI